MMYWRCCANVILSKTTDVVGDLKAQKLYFCAFLLLFSVLFRRLYYAACDDNLQRPQACWPSPLSNLSPADQPVSPG